MMALQTNTSSSILMNTSTWLLLLCMFSILLQNHNTFVVSQTIVKNLPGFDGDLPFKLETGYIGVGEIEEVQLFYYFIESQSSPLDDPLILWLTGGPGCSALSALLYEIGPLTFDYEFCDGKNVTLKYNPYSWTKVANILFVDAPVGTGFSYATIDEAYNTSDHLSASQSYQFLRKWLVQHSEFLANPLMIGGDAYSGKIVPIIAKYISDDIISEHARPYINFRGYIMGNPITDEVKDSNSRIEFAYRVALLSDELYESLKRDCQGEYTLVDPNNTACVMNVRYYKDCVAKLYHPHILEPKCADFRGISNEEEWCMGDNYKWSYVWANDPGVQEALNIRTEAKDKWVRCNKSLAYTKDVNSSLYYIQELVNRGHRVLIYSGDQDLTVPYVGTMKWITSLNLTTYDDWRPWFVNGQISGYTIEYYEGNYKLTYATVKGAGLTAPTYKPIACYNMIDRWLADYAL